MATIISLSAEPRNVSLKPGALRRTKMVPGVVYGRGIAAKSVQFESAALTRTIRQAGTSHLVALSIAGSDTAQRVLVREVQRDPVNGRILHVDLYAIVAGQRIHNMVPLVHRGEASALKLGGIVAQTLDTVEVECTPEDMPEFIELDLSLLVDMHSRIKAGDLVIPAGVTLVTPADMEVVRITIQRMKAEVEEPAAAAAEGEEAKTEEPAAAPAKE
jgi:large subunit ribosomal protein L25